VPIVVRLAGTNVEEGRVILAESGLALVIAEDLDDGARKAAAALAALEAGYEGVPDGLKQRSSGPQPQGVSS
jgi:hypothetical protein